MTAQAAPTLPAPYDQTYETCDCGVHLPLGGQCCRHGRHGAYAGHSSGGGGTSVVIVPPRDSFEIGMVSRIGAGEAGVYELVQQLLITDAMGDGIEPLMPADQVRG